MRWKRALGITAPAAIGIIVAASTPAFASMDSGWVFTQDGNPGGKAYFDADDAGHPGDERLIVCDTQADGYGVIGTVLEPENGFSAQLTDPSATGDCNEISGNFFLDEHGVTIQVCLYKAGVFNFFWSIRKAAMA